MRVYKLHPRTIGERELTVDAFEEDTQKQPPWYQKDAKDNKERHFAVCPACDNPIQIIGLTQRQLHTERPYGRHANKPVPQFALFDPTVFDWCPYLAKNRSGTVTGKRAADIDDIALSILALVLTQYDRVVHILKRDLGFKMFPNQAQDLLTHWFDAEGYLYREATLRNIPWMVAYRARALSLFGQKIESDALRQAIADGIPDLEVTDNGRLVRRTGGRYRSIMWCCIHHRFAMNDEVLEETMEFVVTVDNQNTVVHRKTVSFEPGYFDTLLRLPESQARRDRALLKATREVFQQRLSPDLLHRVEDRARALESDHAATLAAPLQRL